MRQHSRAQRALAAAGGVVMAAVALGACSGDSGDGQQQTPAPSTWGAVQGENATASPEGSPPGDYRVVAATPLNLTLAEDGNSAMVDPTSWPDLREMLSGEQWKGIIPTERLDRPLVCAYGSLPTGSTPKFTQCSWEIGAGYGSKPRVRLQIKAIGADSQVLEKYDGTRAEYRKENVEGDRFYENGAYGARRALLRENGLGSFVVSDGQVAMWIEAQFPDEPLFDGTDRTQSRDRVRAAVYPTLVKTLVTYLPRKH